MTMSESTGRVPREVRASGPPLPFGDARLARRAAAGDERAFAAIYRRYHQDLYRYCLALLRDREDAEDALQATMVKALRALPGETRTIELKPWLFRIAHNEAISLVRRRRPTDEIDPELPELGNGPEQRTVAREQLRELVVDLDQLPEQQRGALIMRELSGLGFEQIGAALGASPAAAKQAVYEARVALQEMSDGREMECGPIREAISAGDRRVLRGRRIRAHLRTCEGCRSFAAAIGDRRSQLAALAPPLAVPAALATLHSVLAGGTAGPAAAGAGLAGIGSGLGAGAAVKAAIAVVATAAIAGGAAELGGVIDVDGSDREPTPPAAPADAQPQTAPGHGSGAAGPGDPAQARGGGAQGSSNGATGRGRGDGQGHGNAHEPRGRGREGAPGQATAPGQTSNPGNSPATPPGQSTTAPGHSASAPGQTGATPGQSSSPGASSQASTTGQTHGGGSAAAPGQTGAAGDSAAAPGQTGDAGDSASAPGHQ